ncbi:hypothetical protein OUZ56_026625 [Daphnia magna]|uniref:Uncharacterized protein n=1 Tax=Daphnia magna TaxID=35525 RepID=A0ABQ9ZNN9_9CRUS|nr:hypothetical protein OUZ56_026625 [Daphnia magna]
MGRRRLGQRIHQLTQRISTKSELIAMYLRLSEDKRCDCPYTIHEEYWCNGLSIAGKMPLVTNLDLVNYLLCSKSPYTHEDLKALRPTRDLSMGELDHFVQSVF